MARKDEIVVDPQVEETPEDAERIGTLGNVFESAPPPIEVEPLRSSAPQPQANGMVKIRVNQDLEDMSYVAGGHRRTYSAKAGQFIDVPVEVAIELEMNEMVYH